MRSARFAAVFLIAMAGAPAADAAGAVKECVTAAERGQRLRDKRELAESREAFIVCAKETCPAAVRVECSAWLADVQQRMPSIVARATDGSGKDVFDVTMYLDGKLVQDKLDGRRIELDPGPHTLRFVRAGARPFETNIVAREGEHNRLVDAVLGSIPAPEAPAPTAVRIAAPPPPTPKPARPFPVAPVVLAGVALVGGGVFAYMASTGKSDIDDLRATCAPRCAQADIDSAHGKIVVADVALGVGIVALGAAVLLLLLPASSAKTDNASFGLTRF